MAGPSISEDAIKLRATVAPAPDIPPAFDPNAAGGWNDLDYLVDRWASLSFDDFTEGANGLTLDQLREGIAQAQAANAEHIRRANAAYELEDRLRSAAGSASAYRSRDEMATEAPRR